MLFYILVIANYVGMWKTYTKMGIEGWKCLIPVYNLYVLFEKLYGSDNGVKAFLLLIPGYNLYVLIRYNIDLAAAFDKSAGYGWGLALLPAVFYMITAFGNAEYNYCMFDSFSSASSSNTNRPDPPAASATGNGQKVRPAKVSSGRSSAKRLTNDEIFEKLRQIAGLKAGNALDESEYAALRKDLIMKLQNNLLSGSSYDSIYAVSEMYKNGILTYEEFTAVKTMLLSKM